MSNEKMDGILGGILLLLGYILLAIHVGVGQAMGITLLVVGALYVQRAGVRQPKDSPTTGGGKKG